MESVKTLATLVLGGAFDANELGDNDIVLHQELIDDLQKRMVTGFDDVHIELIDRAEFDRVTAERDAPQLRLNTADEREDQLATADPEIVAQVESALRRSFNLGQVYWQQADSDSTCQQNKCDQTMETQAQHILNVLKSINAALNSRDEQLHSLEQRRHAEQQACQAAERNAARYLWLRDKPTFIWLIQDWFPSGAEVTDVDAVIDAAINAGADAVAPKAETDKNWRMNPCTQGHRDVGAAGSVAHCYTCDEKIEAATTQVAFELWNATHPVEQPAPAAVVMPEFEPAFEAWWESDGQYCRSGGGSYEKTFAYRAYEAALAEVARLNPIKQ